LAIVSTAFSRVVLLSRSATNAFQNEVRPTAKPMNPGTGAAARSQAMRPASSEPRPRMQFLDRGDHQRRPQVVVIEVLVALQPVGLLAERRGLSRTCGRSRGWTGVTTASQW
jgi:hypothetical protein